VTKPIDRNDISRVVRSIDAFWLQVDRLPGAADADR
jgi:hypothetical protein